MDGSRFDRIARAVAASGSRRRLIGGLVAGALGLAASPAAATRPGTLSAGAHCHKDADCKSGFCQHNPKLRPQASGTCRCRTTADCLEPPACHAVACEDGACVRTKTSGASCTTRDDVAGTCKGGTCVPNPCSPDDDGRQCETGKVCSGGQCVGTGECTTGLTNCGTSIHCGGCLGDSCIIDTEGAAVCTPSGLGCGGPVCATSSDCAAGYVCWPAPCCGQPRCFQVCTTPAGASATESEGEFPNPASQ